MKVRVSLFKKRIIIEFENNNARKFRDDLEKLIMECSKLGESLPKHRTRLLNFKEVLDKALLV